MHLPHVCLYSTSDTKSKGKQSLKRKTAESFLWLLQQLSIPLRDFFNLVFVCKEISPRYGNDKNKVLFSNAVSSERFMNNLSTNALNSYQWMTKATRFLKNVSRNSVLRETLFKQNKF